MNDAMRKKLEEKAREWLEEMKADPMVGMLHGHLWPNGIFSDHLAALLVSMAEGWERDLCTAMDVQLKCGNTGTVEVLARLRESMGCGEKRDDVWRCVCGIWNLVSDGACSKCTSTRSFDARIVPFDVALSEGKGGNRG